jgi:hypothetical protein
LRLSTAIENAARAKETLAAHQAAIERARQQIGIAEAKIEECRTASVFARTSFEGEMAEALAHGRAVPATSRVLSRADAAVLDAQRTAEAVRVARDRLKADLSSHEAGVAAKERAVLREVNELLRPSVERIVADAERGRALLTSCAAVLRYLAGLNSTGAGSSAADREPDDAIPAALRERVRSLSSFAQFNLPSEVVALIDTWRAARRALRSNAGAPLPPLPGVACTGSREESSA